MVFPTHHRHIVPVRNDMKYTASASAQTQTNRSWLKRTSTHSFYRQRTARNLHQGGGRTVKTNRMLLTNAALREWSLVAGAEEFYRKPLQFLVCGIFQIERAHHYGRDRSSENFHRARYCNNIIDWKITELICVANCQRICSSVKTFTG